MTLCSRPLHLIRPSGPSRSEWRDILLAGMLLLLPALVLLASGTASAAPSGNVFTKPFTLYADQQPLPSVLGAFARAQGYTPMVDKELSGSVSGNFTDTPPMEFLQGMQSAFDVSWYVLGSELNFYRTSDRDRIYIIPRTGNASTLYSALLKSGVFSRQLPATLNQSGNTISVSGPARYLAQVKAAATAWESAQADRIVMEVFPLKYAWAEDITVNSMDKTVTIPGIASILRAMVLGSSISGTTVTQQKATVERLGGKGLAALGQEQAPQQEASAATANASPVSSGSVSIIADPRVNAVVVSDAAYRMGYYKRVIADLDRPVDLVEIHVAIVDIDTNFQRELGINLLGAHVGSDGFSVGGMAGGSASSAIPNSSTSSSAGAAISTIYKYGSDFFMSRIQALEQDNVARVLGRPSVLTMDNGQATLENTTTYYIPVQGYQAVDLYKVESGTVLRVTPHIIRENGETAIKLIVSVQDDQGNNSSAMPTTGTGVPPIKQTKINTQAVVGAGQSLLIGGYYYEQKTNGESGVPGVKDVPVLGHLFKSTGKQSRRMERLILITPRITSASERNIPSHADDPSFSRSPVQSNYEERIPTRREPIGAGCGRRAPSPQTASGNL